MKYLIPLLLLPLLSACMDMKENGQRVGNTMQREAELSRDKFRNYFDMTPRAKPRQKAIPSRYCYRFMTDIVCYEDPLPSKYDSRLVGYQEPLVADESYEGMAPRRVDVPVETRAPGMYGHAYDPKGGTPFYVKESPWAGNPVPYRPGPPVTVNAAPGMKPALYQGMEEVKIDQDSIRPKSLMRRGK